ncbi:hypothetical protein B9Z55_008892 [Caenorhabditis nigoni]|uniref:Uncharacterized protein n=1 Tax=Caenorhabditis nigoni TaxID=1611254 RepID=A0A2G5UPK9_9PELO|nr:hypothetical protein B9Z55_008892 [Caenorhabditis nigoni]
MDFCQSSGTLDVRTAPRSCPSRRRECRRSNGEARRNGSTSRQTPNLGKYTTQQWMPELEELISTSSEGVADRLIKQMDKWNEPKLKIIIVLFDLF